MSSEVVFALQDVTVHEKLGSAPEKDQQGREYWPTTSRVLAAGSTVELDKLPPYQADAFKSGKVDSVKVMTKDKAKRLAEEVAEVKDASSGALAVENRLASHSDWLVPDSERAANHAAMAEGDAGAGVASDDEANPLVGEAQATAGGGPSAPADQDTGENDSAAQQRVTQQVKEDGGKKDDTVQKAKDDK